MHVGLVCNPSRNCALSFRESNKRGSSRFGFVSLLFGMIKEWSCRRKRLLSIGPRSSSLASLRNSSLARWNFLVCLTLVGSDFGLIQKASKVCRKDLPRESDLRASMINRLRDAIAKTSDSLAFGVESEVEEGSPS